MIVYHYTSIDVFMKIISDKTMRLSDITKSNDSMELLWITQYIKDIFDEEFQKEIDQVNYFRERYPQNTFVELFERYMDDFFKENIRLYSYFVCCFSEKGDLLSQWRGYADDASGISIGFDGDALLALGKPATDDPISSNVFEYGQVIYLESRQKSLIRKCAHQLIAELKNIAKNKHENLKEASMVAFNNCFLQLFKLSVFIKSPFFEEEKEWRICYWTDIASGINSSNTHISNNIEMSNVGYHVRNNDLIPHIDLHFEQNKGKIIKEVIIGPKCKAREDDIKNVLSKNGIACPVKKSYGSYR